MLLDVLLLMLIAAAVILSVRHMRRHGCGGCTGNCAACHKKKR